MSNRSACASVSEEESGMQLIKVEIFDVHASSTILRIFPDTYASYVCDAIANKIDVPLDQIKFYSLILSVSWISDVDGLRQTYVKTLKNTDLVLEVFQSVMIDQEEKYLSSNNMSLIKRTSRLPLSTDLPFNYQKHNFSTRWFYKDVRTTPLHCTVHKNDVSANVSSSEDEEEISSNDMTYLNQFERKGYFMRRSRSDPNVWRKRYCVLVDNLWCISNPDVIIKPSSVTRKKKAKAKCVKIGANVRVFDNTQGFDYPHTIALQIQSSAGSTPNVLFLAAPNAADHQLWSSELQKRCIINSENQSISIAEIIISDESTVQSEKITRDIMPHINTLFDLPNLQESLFNSKPVNSPMSFSNIHINTTDLLCFADGLDNSEAKVDNIINESEQSCQFLQYCNSKSFLNPESQFALELPVHRSPNSIIHYLNKRHPILAEMINFLGDVSRYKQLHRLELSPLPRMLWVKVMVIYQKYISHQVKVLMGQRRVGASDSEKSNGIEPTNEKSYYSDVSILKLKRDQILERQERYMSSEPSKSDNRLCSAENLTQRGLGDSGRSLTTWEISSNSILALHKRIFSNIRRQIAGFDVPSMKLLKIDDDSQSSNSNNKYNFESLAETQPQNYSEPDSIKAADLMAKANATSDILLGTTATIGMITNAVSNQQGVFGWFWGQAPAIAAPESSSTKQNFAISDNNIRYNEIFNLGEPGAVKKGVDYGSRTLFQIKDLEETPSIVLFDEVVLEVQKCIRKYLNN